LAADVAIFYYSVELLIAMLLATGVSIALGVDAGHIIIPSALFVVFATALMFVWSPRHGTVTQFLVAVFVFVVAAAVLVYVRLLYWDRASILLDICGGPYERVGYFPGGDAWFPVAVIVWGGSALALSVAAFLLSAFLRVALRRAT